MSKKSPTYESQTFLGKVLEKDGERKLILNSPALYNHFLKTTCRVGDEVALSMTNRRPKRSLQQSNYYRLYLSLISLSSGHTPEELHVWAKGKFLSKGIKEIFGHKVRVVTSTARLTIGEFCEYICRIEDETTIPCPKTDPFLKPLSHDEYAELKEEQKQAYTRMKAKIVMSNKL